jgi:murein L,D-transpeptidase YafK
MRKWIWISGLVVVPMVLAAWMWPTARQAPVLASSNERADFVFIDKSERRLELHRDGLVLRRYEIALGGNPLGPKRAEGDRRTPEGDYIIDRRNAQSAYHLSLHINYPNEADRAESARLGVPPGGDIFIHGLPNRYPLGWAPKLDWTLGCIVLNDAEIAEIWRLVPDGTPIRIVP